MGIFDLDIEFEQANIHLSVGDLLVDNVSGRVGVLIKRERRISIEDDDRSISLLPFGVVFDCTMDCSLVASSRVISSLCLKPSCSIDNISGSICKGAEVERLCPR